MTMLRLHVVEMDVSSSSTFSRELMCMKHFGSQAQTKHGLCQLALLQQNFFWWVPVVAAVSELMQPLRAAMVAVVGMRVECAQL
jgi:hypothetical protein